MTTIRLERGETAIVGYGSLISRRSLERTLGRPYEGPFVACHVSGWRRAFDIGMPNAAYYFLDGHDRIYPRQILYLNVRPSADAFVNAVVFAIGAADLAAMHAREWIYEPRVVTGMLRGVTVEGGDAVMYVARPDYLVTEVRDPRDAAVRASYLRIVGEGLSEMGTAFRAEYNRTTDPVPPELVIDDVLDVERPHPWTGTAARSSS